MLRSSLPLGVAATKKEYYLSDEEFAQYIGMPKAEWDALKQWKKDRKKQDIGLFWDVRQTWLIADQVFINQKSVGQQASSQVTTFLQACLSWYNLFRQCM